MDKELIKKYLNNNCTGDELNSVLMWFEKSAGTDEGKDLLFRIWEEMSDDKGNLNTDFELILNKIHHQINLVQSKNLLERSDQNPVKYKRREYVIKVLTKAAAILLLPVFGFGLYMSSKYYSIKHSQISANQAYNEVYSSVDAITKVTLPDGSNVWLNHSSILKYPSMFTGNSRTVELKGEGYFEVVHNPKTPFIVKAGEIEIVARGTVFNVLAYPDEDKIETSLVNGIVEIRRMEDEGRHVTLLTMKPTDMAVYQK
jgi:ferric-dicitrate binding protein FerR (iron transport regulator)